jgi:plasmid stabilization system protein ParE
MVQIVWTEPALADLDAIADHIALGNPAAAKALVQRTFRHVKLLERNPLIGPRVPEVQSGRYRQISEPPCRVIYLVESNRVFILHVVRSERILQTRRLSRRRTKLVGKSR